MVERITALPDACSRAGVSQICLLFLFSLCIYFLFGFTEEDKHFERDFSVDTLLVSASATMRQLYLCLL